MVGRLVKIDQNGELLLEEGDYGKGRDGVWYVRPPEAKAGSLAQHTVIEHEDGTISADPSILITFYTEGHVKNTWHGYLKCGIWQKC